ncbi:hypothetical protein LXA43DRAFT_977885 [Ganoderma leucocontextum]|nr:hypothetical protein LXA43DRAFT_977885 [Ganoderma leucocontextum]
MRGEEVPESTDDSLGNFISGDFTSDHDDEITGPDQAPTSVNQSASTNESITYAIRDILDARYQYRFKKDTRTWRDRRRNFDENWRPLVPLLVKAYYQWRYPTDEPPVDSEMPDASIDISVVDLYTLNSRAVIPITPDQRNAEALVAAGYLGNSPIQPSLAISLKTLELFRTLRLFKPSFSAEAFAKLVCHHYRVPYRRHFRTSLSDAFDIYLMILDRVESDVLATLGRDGPHWRALNSCPPCSYQLEGEDAPTFSRMMCFDGNNSLKRLAAMEARQEGDTRDFHSDYYIPRSEVDLYANEVKSRQKQPKPDLVDPDPDDDDTPGGDDNDEGYPTDGAIGGAAAPCADHWKAAAADSNKKMWKMFDETGYVVCACRHGLVLWVVDMVRSGELAKYVLALLARILDHVPGRKLLGYDIGCVCEETVRNSSLGDEFKKSGSRFCVNAFHGYSHSYNCQVKFHPTFIAGTGIEDLETLERLFSASNSLAPVTRYASRYRRKAFIHMFLQQWDREKYANLGLMLYNNYVQALEIIATLGPAVEEALRELNLTREQLGTLQAEEKEYFVALRDEDPANLHTIVYVELLEEYYDVTGGDSGTETILDLSFAPVITGNPGTWESGLSETRKIETRRRYLRSRLDQLTDELSTIEQDWGIERWKRGDHLYQKALEYIASRRYQRALGKLQRLVIQRLFELHKLNLAQTGYRARTYLAKNLQRRCRTIRNAVTEYNAAARSLDPPRPPVDWEKVSHYTFIEEFSLLQDTRNDLSAKEWARPDVRKTTCTARRVDRAHEEIANANREVRRLLTSIRDEEVSFNAILVDLRTKRDPHLGAVQDFVTRRRGANARNLAYIEQIHTLEGFTGDRTPGRRVGRAETMDVEDAVAAGLSAGSSSSGLDASDTMADTALDDDDEANEEVTSMIEYLAGLTV